MALKKTGRWYFEDLLTVVVFEPLFVANHGKKLRIGLLEFGSDRLYENNRTDFGKFRAALQNKFVEVVTFLAHGSDCDNQNRYQNGTQLRQPFCRIHRTPIFQSIQRTKT